MPKKTTGVTSTSFDNFLIDAGAVYINYDLADERILGATNGGNSFQIETEIRSMEVDGLRQDAIGQKRIINVSARITVNLIELTAENVSLALAGSTIADYTPAGGTAATHDSITRSRNLATFDYIQNIALVGKMQGKTDNFVGILYNALSDGGIELGMEDEGEASIELAFTAHVDPDTILDDGTFTEAWDIRLPKA